MMRLLVGMNAFHILITFFISFGHNRSVEPLGYLNSFALRFRNEQICEKLVYSATDIIHKVHSTEIFCSVTVFTRQLQSRSFMR